MLPRGKKSDAMMMMLMMTMMMMMLMMTMMDEWMSVRKVFKIPNVR
jgi:hypothetical protein